MNTLFPLSLALLTSLACRGADGTDGAPAPGPQPLDDLSTLEKAFVGIGGAQQLQTLESYTTTATGLRFIAGEGFRFDEDSVPASTFEFSLRHSIASDRLRIDYKRNILFAGAVDLEYSEIVDGHFGYVEGIDSLFGEFGSTTEMPSSRTAAVNRQVWLTNPHLILQEIQSNPDMAQEAGVALFGGELHDLLEVEDEVAPITLWVHQGTGEIAKLETTENHHVLRDSAIEVVYADWQQSEVGPSYPRDVFISKAGQLVHQETREDVAASAELADSLFAFPDGAKPVHDEALAAWGRANHQFHQEYTSLGFPIDRQETFVDAAMLSSGVWFLGGGNYNSLLLERENDLVLVEAPLYPARSVAIAAWAAAQFPEKSIGVVISTHHHADHVGGLREFAAAGATIVASEKSATLYRKIMSARSTITPDTMAQAPVTAAFQWIGDETVRLEDGVLDIAIVPIATRHAGDMVIVHVPSIGLVFNSDLFEPGVTELPPNQAQGLLSPDEAADFLAAVNTLPGAPPSVLVGGHGGVGGMAELSAFASR